MIPDVVLGQSREGKKVVQKAHFQRPCAMNGYRQSDHGPILAVDVMTASYSAQLPAVSLQRLDERPPRDLPHMAISTTRDPPGVDGWTSTDKQPSTAS